MNKRRNRTNHKMRTGLTRLVAGLVLCACCLGALPHLGIRAESTAGSGVTSAPAKREVVFGSLDASGGVHQLYVVNHFDVKRAQTFEDYGPYSEVVQLTGDRAPVLGDDDTVTLAAEKGHYYYQGNLKTKALPWRFDIRYRLDGKEKKTTEIAGASGRLELLIDIRQNPEVDAFFFETYSLQISAELDPEKVDILEVDKAAILADNGTKRQVNWIVLPNQEMTLSLTADVRDFEMPPLTIAGAPLNLEFELPDFSDDMAPLDDLSDGIRQLADGADELETGYVELVSHYDEIVEGGEALAEGGEALESGGSELADGMGEYAAGINRYTDGVMSVSQGVSHMVGGLGTLREGLAELSTNGDQLRAGSTSVRSGLEQIASKLPEPGSFDEVSLPTWSDEDLAQLDELVAGSQAVKEALGQISIGMQGLSQLHGGLQQLEATLGELKEQAAVFVLPEQTPVAMTEEEWKGYLLTLSVTMPEASEAILLPQLAGMSQLAAGYVGAVTMLNGTLDGLLDPTQGVPALTAGAAQLLPLVDAMGQLDAQYDALHEGIVALVGQVKALAELSASYAPLLDQLSQLEALFAGLRTMAEEYAAFDEGVRRYTDGVDQMLVGVDGSEATPGLLPAAKQLEVGIGQVAANGPQLKTGADELKDGALSLKGGLGEFMTGVTDYVSGVATYRKDGLDRYRAGLAEFTDGTSELREETADLRQRFEDGIQERIDELTEGDVEPKSYTSAKNKKIDNLQFVFMTDAITKPDNGPESSFATEDEGGFFERLARLFRREDD